MFIPLANLTDLYDGYQKPVSVAGKSYVLLQAEGQVYLLENRCPHMDAPLSGGQIQGTLLRCRAHGIGFSLLTGRAEGSLSESMDCLKFFPLVYEGDMIGVDLQNH